MIKHQMNISEHFLILQEQKAKKKKHKKCVTPQLYCAHAMLLYSHDKGRGKTKTLPNKI